MVDVFIITIALLQVKKINPDSRREVLPGGGQKTRQETHIPAVADRRRRTSVRQRLWLTRVAYMGLTEIGGEIPPPSELPGPGVRQKMFCINLEINLWRNLCSI